MAPVRYPPSFEVIRQHCVGRCGALRQFRTECAYIAANEGVSFLEFANWVNRFYQFLVNQQAFL